MVSIKVSRQIMREGNQGPHLISSWIIMLMKLMDINGCEVCFAPVNYWAEYFTCTSTEEVFGDILPSY